MRYIFKLSLSHLFRETDKVPVQIHSVSYLFLIQFRSYSEAVIIVMILFNYKVTLDRSIMIVLPSEFRQGFNS